MFEAQQDGIIDLIDLDNYENLMGKNKKQNAIDQRKEFQKVVFFELKLFEFLISSLNQVQLNLRNITALWAKDLGIDDEINPSVDQSQQDQPQ